MGTIVFARGQALALAGKQKTFNDAVKRWGGIEYTMLSMASAEMTDWIPGDGGYVKNPVPPADPNSERAGENIIYLGNGIWWGFTGGESKKTLDDWIMYVGGWSGQKLDPKNKKDRNQMDSLVNPTRLVPRLGLEGQ